MMDYIREFLTLLLIIIPLSAVPRAIYCLNIIATDPEQESSYKKRLKNLLVFVVIAECSVELIYLLQSYFI